MSLSKRVIKSEEIRILGDMPRTSARAMGDDFEPFRHTEKLPSGCGAFEKEKAGRKIEDVRKDSFDKGFSEGIKKGFDLYKKEYASSMNAVTDLIKELSSLKRKIMEGAETQLLGLAFAVAEKVIHQETSTNREVIESVLREAMKNIVERDGMKIRLNPQDCRYLMEIKPDFLQSFAGVRNVGFEEDPTVMQGGAVIETAFGEVDARLDKQLDEIRAIMYRG